MVIAERSLAAELRSIQEGNEIALLEIKPTKTPLFQATHVLRRSGILFQFLRGVSGPPEAQLIHTLSKFHCLIHKLYLTKHHSSQEHEIDGTSAFFLLS